jgi:DNA repair ATPase RecN
VISTINELDQAVRQEELAAMLDGTPISASSLQSAAEMLERATATKLGVPNERRKRR